MNESSDRDREVEVVKVIGLPGEPIIRLLVHRPTPRQPFDLKDSVVHRGDER
jgi:hypothetical protein